MSMVPFLFYFPKKLGIYRILGTIAGAVWAIIVWYVCGTNPYGIFFMMFLFMVPANYISYSTRYTKIAFVSVVALLVIILSRRNNIIMHTTRTDEIYVLAYKRATEGKKLNGTKVTVKLPLEL
jgi:uncharacterized membrane protein YgaE (UPF0421/DUF939 family)